MHVRVKETMVHWGVDSAVMEMEAGAAREEAMAVAATRRVWRCMVGVWALWGLVRLVVVDVK